MTYGEAFIDPDNGAYRLRLSPHPDLDGQFCLSYEEREDGAWVLKEALAYSFTANDFQQLADVAEKLSELEKL